MKRRLELLAIALTLILISVFLVPLAAQAQVSFPSRGGTGTSTKPTLGQILIGLANGTYAPQATSSLGLLTTNVAEGSNLYFTDARVGTYLTSSTTLPTLLNYWTKTDSDLAYTGGTISIADGSASLPALAFGSQANMGFHMPATNQTALSIGGTTKYKWTGTGFELTSDKALIWRSASNGSQGSADTHLWRNAADFVEMRDGTDANQFGVYNTYTSASQYERAIFGFQQNANILSIGTQAAGTGTVRNIALIGGNVGIGTTSPAAKLDVFGDARIGVRTLGSYRYLDIVAGSASASIQARRSDTAGAVDLTIQTSGGNTLLNPVLGSVGIGTSTPGSLLDLFSTGTTTLRIDSSAADKGSCLAMKDSDGSGYTYLTAEDGVLSASAVACY